MTSTKPNLMFSHLGISVTDLPKMEAFYTDMMGFTVTDRGPVAGLDVVFMSRDPLDHHQIVLATGRPEVLPENTGNPMFGPCINQISFRMGSFADLRDMHTRLLAGGYKEEGLLCANHGLGWSIYFPDPERNVLECFVDSDWYMDQPALEPLDFSKTDDEIIAETKAICEASPGFEPIGDWRARTALKMTKFRPAD
ncbi:VOC family protein [Sphingobium sp.]|uniref:VOC family protein n=1 Tax=Sphingobium sp. TaxID=1912891 RepID=UPI0028BE356C|nr:VOC family protein [Sphingobium sp.]